MKTDPVADFLDDLRLSNEAHHDLVLRLRKTILDLDARITEEIKYGGILFTLGSPVCGVFAYDHHVSLEFGRGAELPDPHKVLEGAGKLRRHIKVSSQPELFRKNVREYVQLALDHMASTRAAQRSAKGRGPGRKPGPA